MQLKVIAYAHNGHTDKFGIPRQSREESPILTRIVFEPEYSVAEALRGIEGYSHLWLLWGFSETQRTSPTTNAVNPPQSDCRTASAVGLSWSPTVRPPRLGGNKRMGVFATRSPFRPNPIGLSSVRLLEVRLNKNNTSLNYSLDGIHNESGRIELIVSGADLLDGTPIYDIKPYLSFSDCHENARNGFAEATQDYQLEVDWSQLETKMEQPKCEKMLNTLDNVSKSARSRFEVDSMTTRNLMLEIEYILSQDPRPAYQDDPEREYKMDYAGLTVTFVVADGKAIVRRIEALPERQ